MKFAALNYENEARLGVVDSEVVTLLPAHLGDLTDVVRGGPRALANIAAELDGAPDIRLAQAALLPPIRRFRRDILCTGWNYWDHFEEGIGRREGQEVERPQHPTFFTKGPECAIGPHDDIGFDEMISTKWDFEVELALVIGRDGRNIPEAEALDHVFGYCLANDVSQRDLQRAHGGQWLKGKSIDGTMPLGPFVVTADEIDPANVEIECLLNGEVVQSASTAQMAFSIPLLIAELSFGMTLRAGDVLLTGTPAGVGHARTPQLFLKAGDILESRSPQLGKLRNMLRPVDLHSPWSA